MQKVNFAYVLGYIYLYIFCFRELMCNTKFLNLMLGAASKCLVIFKGKFLVLNPLTPI